MENIFETLANITNPNKGLVKIQSTFIDCDSPKVQTWKGKKYMRPLDLYNLYKNGVLTSIRGFETDYYGNGKVSLYFNNELVCNLWKHYGFNFSTQFEIEIDTKFLNYEN